MSKTPNENSNHLENISRIIANDYGFANSVRADIPLDHNCQPIPLYTYPVIEYLNSLDFAGKNIFEFGSGQSTLYWLGQGANVASVEHNQDWMDKISSSLKSTSNHQYFFAKQQDDYVNSILKFPDFYFDMIVIDGSFSRYLCAQNVISKIRKDGLIILDNSDWYPNSAQFLRENLNFIEIDFYGFRPSKPEAAVTSMFFSREFKLRCKGARQPNYAMGGKINHSNLDQ